MIPSCFDILAWGALNENCLGIQTSGFYRKFLLPNFITCLLLHFQVKIKLEPLSVSLVRSAAAITSQASVTTVTMSPHSSGGGINDGFHPEKSTAIPYVPAQQQAPTGSASVHQERAPRYFSLTQRGHQGHKEGQPDPCPLLPDSPEKAGAPPGVPSSSVGHREQREVLLEGWRGRKEEEQGGAREDGIQEKLHSSDRDRGEQPQHPKHSAEPSVWRGEPEPPPSRRPAESQEERGRGATHSSSKQEPKRSQGGISGKWYHSLSLKRNGAEQGVKKIEICKRKRGQKKQKRESEMPTKMGLLLLSSLSSVVYSHAWLLCAGCTHKHTHTRTCTSQLGVFDLANAERRFRLYLISIFFHECTSWSSLSGKKGSPFLITAPQISDRIPALSWPIK